MKNYTDLEQWCTGQLHWARDDSPCCRVSLFLSQPQVSVQARVQCLLRTDQRPSSPHSLLMHMWREVSSDFSQRGALGMISLQTDCNREFPMTKLFRAKDGNR